MAGEVLPAPGVSVRVRLSKVVAVNLLQIPKQKNAKRGHGYCQYSLTVRRPQPAFGHKPRNRRSCKSFAMKMFSLKTKTAESVALRLLNSSHRLLRRNSELLPPARR